MPETMRAGVSSANSVHDSAADLADRNSAHPNIAGPPVGCCAPRRVRLSRCLSSCGHAPTGCCPLGGGPHTVSLASPGPDFDPQYAMTTDLDEPLIIASVTADGTGQPSPLLIDGCHRLYKAARLGHENLPSLMLTPEETLAIRHDAILGPPRPPARRHSGSRENRP